MSWPSRVCHWATTPRPSSGHMDWREVRSSRVTDTAALALTASKFTSVVEVRKRLSPQCSWTSGAPGRRRGQHVGNDGQRLEIDLDLGRHVLGLGARGRGAERDQLADVAHLAGGQYRLHGRLEARQRGVGADRRDAVEIIGDEHVVANGRRDRDALDARVRDRAAEERHLQHAGQADVADILPPPAHVAVVLLAQEPRADALGRRHPLRQSSGGPILARNATIGYRAPCMRSGRSRPTPTRWPKRSRSRATSAAGSGGRSREATLASRCATLPVPNSTTSMPGSCRAKR